MKKLTTLMLSLAVLCTACNKSGKETEQQRVILDSTAVVAPQDQTEVGSGRNSLSGMKGSGTSTVYKDTANRLGEVYADSVRQQTARPTDQ